MKFLVLTLEDRTSAKTSVFATKDEAIEYGNQEALKISEDFLDLIEMDGAIAFSAESDLCSIYGKYWDSYLIEVPDDQLQYAMVLIEDRYLRYAEFGESETCRNKANEAIGNFLATENIDLSDLNDDDDIFLLDPEEECDSDVAALYDYDIDAWVVKI